MHSHTISHTAAQNTGKTVNDSTQHIGATVHGFPIPNPLVQGISLGTHRYSLPYRSEPGHKHRQLTAALSEKRTKNAQK